MENKFPKNVRQIGNVSDTPKIYVEDYVNTFLNQICTKADSNPAGAFLVGEIGKTENVECVYISGAICMEFPENQKMISDESMEKAKRECKEYFDDNRIVGWMICRPGIPIMPDSTVYKLHEQYFPEKYSVLIMKDNAEMEKIYFCYKYKELMQMGGHYIYYEKNAAMQSYMIASRKRTGVTPSEVVEDKAAKDFRNLVKERVEVQVQNRHSKLLYTMRMACVIAVLVIGAVTLNNYGNMKNVQSSLEFIRKAVGKEDSQKMQTTSGNVKAAGTEKEEAGERTTSETEVPAEAETDSGDSAETGENATSDETENKEETAETAASTMQEMSEDIYIVEKGDTLAKISKKVYGDSGHVDAICRMNGLSDGNLIFIGQKLLLP